MSEQDASLTDQPAVLAIYEIAGPQTTPAEDESSDYPLTLEAGSMAVIMTLDHLGAEDLDQAEDELRTGSYEEQVRQSGANLVILLGRAETDRLLWAEFHVGTVEMNGVQFLGLLRKVVSARQQAAGDRPYIPGNGPLVAMAYAPGEVAIGDQLRL